MSDTASAPDLRSLPVPLTSPPSDPSTTANQQFLRLQLVSDMTALLPVEQLTEVLTIPTSQVVPIPHMPTWVMGVYNWRGEILWMVDLGNLCGLTPWYRQTTNRRSAHKAVVLRQSDHLIGSNTAKVQMLGLVVNEVEDIEWCDPTLIQSPLASTVTPELAPFLRGYWWKSDGDMLVFLDESAIFEAMPKA